MIWRRKRKENRKREAEETVRWHGPLRIVAITGGLLLASWGGVNYLQHSDWERFRTLEVTGELRHVSARQVKEVLQPHMASGFAGIDIREARRALEREPWIADAGVRRRWPGVLVVDIREERPIATWSGSGLLNAEGEVFVDAVNGYVDDLPDIGGPSGSQVEMIERMAELEHALRDRGLELRRLARSDRRAERLWLANGIEVRLGRRETDTRLSRFLNAAWPAVQVEVERVAYIDMRYANGFAVGWKKTAQANEQAPGV